MPRNDGASIQWGIDGDEKLYSGDFEEAETTQCTEQEEREGICGHSAEGANFYIYKYE